MNYVRSFAPWLCYAVLSPVDWRLGMSAAAVAALVLVVLEARARQVALLGAVTCVFFVVMAGVAIADPASALRHWTCALANGALAAVALVSLAVRRPFTLAIARTQVPREFWNAPRFIRVNMVLTAIWAAAFTAAAIVCAAIIRYDHAASVPLITTQVLGFVVPFVVSGAYANRAQAAARARA